MVSSDRNKDVSNEKVFNELFKSLSKDLYNFIYNNHKRREQQSPECCTSCFQKTLEEL